jgi:transposase-like protein
MAQSKEGTNGRGQGARRSEAKERFWRGHVARQQRSDESVRAYCRDHELAEPSFYAWRRKLARRDALASQVQRRAIPAARSPSPRRRVTGRPATFLPIAISDGLAAPVIEVQLASGVVIRVPASDQVSLRAVLEAVEARSC